MLLCAYCGNSLAYIHGHGACTNVCCLYYGLNQAECCTGETACNVPASTTEVAAVRSPQQKPVSK